MRIRMMVFWGLMQLVQFAQAAELFGVVDAVAGTASFASESGTTAVTVGDKVYTGQSVVTGADGEVHIVTADSGLIALRPNSSFRIDRYQAKGETTDEIVFSLLKGALRSITGWIAKRNPASYQLNTLTTTIGVRGTDHETTVIETATGDSQPGTYDTVYEGATVMRSAQGSVEAHAGEHAFAPRDATKAPELLARMPAFMEHRTLRLEQRVQQRKDNLHQSVQSRLQELNDKARTIRRNERERPRREPRPRQRLQ
jgi:hypothetical protein